MSEEIKNIMPVANNVTYGTVCDFLEVFGKRYPFIDIFEIGKSIRGRSIFCIRLGRYDASASVVYVGAHHGAESLTSGLLLRYINEFCEYKRDSRRIYGYSIPFVFCERCVYVIPMLNPDGVENAVYGASTESPIYERIRAMNKGDDFRLWQSNERGVDLNHNYNAGFAEYKKIEQQEGITAGRSKYSGQYPESEPETKALCGFIRTAEPKGILTLHTQGEEIYYKSGGYAPPKGENTAKLISKMSGYSLSEATGTAAYGGLTDWFIKEFDRPSFTLECGKGTNPLPIKEFESIYAKIRETLFSFPMML